MKSPLGQWERHVGKWNFLGAHNVFITEQTWNCEKRQPFSGTQYCFLSQEEKWNYKARWHFSEHSCLSHRKENGTLRIGIRLCFLAPFLTLLQAFGSVCHVTPRCEHASFLHECFFDFMFCFICDRWQNQVTCLHQVLREAQ
jgi:hypothetical protein